MEPTSGKTDDLLAAIARLITLAIHDDALANNLRGHLAIRRYLLVDAQALCGSIWVNLRTGKHIKQRPLASFPFAKPSRGWLSGTPCTITARSANTENPTQRWLRRGMRGHSEEEHPYGGHTWSQRMTIISSQSSLGLAPTFSYSFCTSPPPHTQEPQPVERGHTFAAAAIASGSQLVPCTTTEMCISRIKSSLRQ